MRKLSVFFCAIAFAGGVRASWYWPFGPDEGVDKSPKRISELMEPATKLIDEASDFAADGKIDEAVESYRKALFELDRIERENHDRAKGSEFATLRNKRAYVNAAIDSMLLSQVKQNARAVAVSDTTELERKLAEERWTGHMEKASSSLLRKDMVTAKTELNEAFGCYTNAFARAGVHNVSASAGFLSGDFKEVYQDLAKSKSCILGYRAGDPFIDQAIDNSLSRIRGLLTDYGEILETAKVVKVEGNVVSNYISHLDYVQSRLASYDLDAAQEAKKLYVAAMNLREVSTNVTPSAAEAFTSAVSDFNELSSKVAGAWKILAHAEFPVLKERVSDLIGKANANMSNAKKVGKESGKAEQLIMNAETELARFQREHPEFADLPGFVALRNMCDKVKGKQEKELTPKVSKDNPGAVRPSSPATLLTKRDQAIADIANGDYAAAELVISEMLAENPNGAMALNLRAAMEVKQGKLDAAEKTLKQAIAAKPRNYSAYYNLAMLLMRKDAGNKAVARRHYETGRAYGGPENAELEALLK